MSSFPGLYDFFPKLNTSDSYTFNYPCSSPIQCSPIKLRFPPGKFRIECWGAQGGTPDNVEGGKGGYASGEIELFKYVNAFLYIGAQGYNCNQYEEDKGCISQKTFNGGGQGKSLYDQSGFRKSTSGGGGTDIRFLKDSLYNRVIVAGGGGGSGSFKASLYGGAGGGEKGKDGIKSSISENFVQGTGATQTYPGYSAGFDQKGKGDFGIGGNGESDGCGGGGGWYGGGGGKQASSGGGGGSGFILTDSPNSLPNLYSFKNKQFSFTNPILKDGEEQFLTPYSLQTEEKGHSGNGAIRITILHWNSNHKYFCYKQNPQIKLSLSALLYIFILLS